MKWTRMVALGALALATLGGCLVDPEQGQDEQDAREIDPEHAEQGGYYEGVEADEDPNLDLEDGGDRSSYDIPPASSLPQLANPEIIVSLSKPLVLHIFDRETKFSAVYPVGVGVLGSSGVSITPSGHFRVGSADQTDSWYWVKRRTNPAYFDGLPFLRLSILNSAGAHTYGFHGPITQTLKQDYVSHGCMRMAADDIIDLFWMLYYRNERQGSGASRAPVSIVPGRALDRAGRVLDKGAQAEIWAVGEPINWQAMGMSPRPESHDPPWGE